MLKHSISFNARDVNFDANHVTRFQFQIAGLNLIKLQMLLHRSIALEMLYQNLF